MGGYNVLLPKPFVRAPRVNGHIVRMHARLVDERGRRVTIRDVMLHHVVFRRMWHPRVHHECTSPAGEAFYGTGEENQSLRLPPGYGYRITTRDRWKMTAMLMSHSARLMSVYVQYRVTVNTDPGLTPVRAFWVRANGCGRDSSYAVDGGGPPGSTNLRTYEWQVPFDGRIVAAGGHLHGGAKDMWLSQPRCEDRRLLGTRPAYGFADHLVYRARPILHEPGPIDTRYFLSRTGIPVARGERLRLTGAYDAERPHGVMAIMHLYVAPGPLGGGDCAPLPEDRLELAKYRRVRNEPPAVHVPLNGLDERGHTYPITDPPWPVEPFAGSGVIDVRRDAFVPTRVSLPAGSDVTWRFADTRPHNVRLANGPRQIDAPTLSGGQTYTRRFSVPGHYELFCSLHPLTMHHVVEVR
jgi:hypothetical protein